MKMNEYLNQVIRDNYMHLQVQRCPEVDEWISYANNHTSVKLIHYSNSKDLENGYGKGLGHGCVFNKEIPEDVALAKEVLHSYDKNNLKCPLTLELIEKNYLTPSNLPLTLQLLQKID